MEAIVFDENGLRWRDDVELAWRPEGREVVVEISAAGVCHSDLKVISGATSYPLPVVLGHEGTGRVVDIGGGVTSVAVGDTVVVHTLRFCGRCRRCAAGYPTQCRGGLGAIGQPFVIGSDPVNQFANTSAFCERTIVSEEQVVAIDPAIPPACAALLGCGVLTGAGAVFNRARVTRGDRAVVLGLGGVGLNVVQAAAIAGASVVVAVDTNPEKEMVAATFGATHFVLGGDGVVDRIRKIEPTGVDHAFVCIGSAPMVTLAASLLDAGGQAVIVGFPGPGISVEIPLQPLYQDKSILACRYGTSSPHRDIPLLAELYLAGRLKLDELVSQTLPLADAPAAFDDMVAGRVEARTVLLIETDDMPHIKLYATAGRTTEEKHALMEAADQGLVEGAGIPEWDRQVRLFEFGPDNILLPETDDHASYVLVEVIGYPRSIEVKRDIYRCIVKRLAEVGVDPMNTKITYYDVPADCWGVNGGQAGSDLAAAQGTGDNPSGWSAWY